MWFTFGLFWKTTFLLFSSLVSCLTARMPVSYAIRTLTTRTGFLWYKLSGLNMKERTHTHKVISVQIISHCLFLCGTHKISERMASYLYHGSVVISNYLSVHKKMT